MKNTRRFLSSIIIGLVVLVLFGLIVPNLILAPKMKQILLKELNKDGNFKCSIDSLFVNVLATSVTIRGSTISAVQDDIAVNVTLPRTTMKLGLVNLLTLRQEPKSLRFDRPKVVIYEPAGPTRVAMGTSSRTPLSQGESRAGHSGYSPVLPGPSYAPASLFPILPLFAVGQTKSGGLTTIQKIVVEQGTLRYEYRYRTPYQFTIDRIDLLLKDVVLDAKFDLKQCDLEHLIGYWPGDSEPGIRYKGRLIRPGNEYQGRVKGEIRRFPLLSVRKPVKQEYDIDIASGNADLISDVLFQGTILDSTHTLIVRDLEITMDRSILDSEKSDYGNLIVELLRLTSGGDEHIVKDIRLSGDFSEDPEDVLDEIAQDALDQIATQLANSLLDRLRHGKDKIKDKRKDIGESLMEALEGK